MLIEGNQYPLEPGYSSIEKIDLEQEEYFTKKQFKEIINSAMAAHRNYYLSVVETTLSEVWVLDAVEYCKYLGTDNADKCPVSDSKFKNIEFYKIDPMESFEQLQTTYITHFCSLRQIVGGGYYLHEIRLSDPSNDLTTKQILEYHLTIDYLDGRGIQVDPETALALSESYRRDGNPFCKLQFSYDSIYGLNNVEQNIPLSSYLFYSVENENKDVLFYVQPPVLQQFRNLPRLEGA